MAYLHRGQLEEVFAHREILDVLRHLLLIHRAVIDEHVEEDHGVLEQLEEELVALGDVLDGHQL